MNYDKEQKEMQMIDRYLDGSDQDILEVGCGEGSISALLAPKARKYIAIDPDPKRLSKARLANPKVDFRIGNGESLSFAKGTFSRVLFTLSLHHQKSRVALQEAYRVLTEDGCVVIVEPSVDGEFQQFFHLFNDETEALKLALNAIEQSDFELEYHETFFTNVTFNDHEELCNYPFDRSTCELGDRIRILDTLHRLCGSFVDGQPIYLQETLHIFLLRKRNVS